jgi:uncharacterized protein (DUF1778 family)
MAKTITVRVDEDVYKMIKTAANGVRRTISNFIEFATLSYISNETFVSDKEMDTILENKELIKSLGSGEKDIKKGRYKIVR